VHVDPAMKVRTRSFVILVTVLVLFLAMLGFVTQHLILGSFQSLENREMTANIQRVVADLDDQKQSLSLTCRDWAGRKDLFTTADSPDKGPAQEIRTGDLAPGAADIDYILAYNANGELVYYEDVDHPGNDSLSVRTSLDRIIRDSILPPGMSLGISGRGGLSVIDGTPILLTGCTIPGANASEPARGTLVIVRMITGERINRLENNLQIPAVSLHRFDGNTSASAPDPQTLDMEKGHIVTSPQNDTQMLGPDHDYGDREQAGISSPKSHLPTGPVYQQVQTSIIIVAIAIVILGALIILSVQYLMQRFALDPLATLDRNIKAIGILGRTLAPGARLR